MKFHYLRPPYGDGIFTDNKSHDCAKHLNDLAHETSLYNEGLIDIAMWSVDSLFQKGHLSKSDFVISTFKKNLHSGNIFLYHTQKEDIKALKEMIKYAKEEGFDIVRLEEM